MSLMDFFRIGYQIEREQEAEKFEDRFFRGNIRPDESNKVLKHKVTEMLIKFGFNLEQIMLAHRIYKFSDLDEAIFYMMKDSETGKYNHNYYKKEIEKENKNQKSENNNNNIYLNIFENCFICGGHPNEHIDFEFKEIKLEIEKTPKIFNPIKGKVLNNVSISCDNLNNQSKNLLLENKSDLDLKNKLDINKIPQKRYKSDEEREKEKEENEEKEEENEEKEKPIEVSEMKQNNEENDNKQIIDDIQNYQDTNCDGFIIKNPNAKLFDSAKSEYKINIDKATLDDFENPNICIICFSNKTNDHNKSEFSCGHKFCKPCVKKYLTTNIKQGKVIKIYYLINKMILRFYLLNAFMEVVKRLSLKMK